MSWSSMSSEVIGAGGQQGGLVHCGAFFRREQAQLLHRKLHLVAIKAGTAFGPDQRAHGDGVKGRAEGVPDLGLQRAAGVGQGQPPIGAVAGLPLHGLTHGKQSSRLAGGGNVFDVAAFFHISSLNAAGCRRATDPNFPCLRGIVK